MNEPRNPYAPPTTPVTDRDESIGTDGGRFIPYGRVVSAGRGAAWIGDAWGILKGQFGMWAAAAILVAVVWIILSLIPIVNIFVQLLMPFIVSGIALCADQQRREGAFDLKSLVGGFDRHIGPLLLVALTTFLAGVVFVVILILFLGGDILSGMMGRTVSDPAHFLTTKFWLAFLVGLALMLPVYAATYLAPQLIVLHDQPAVEAMKMSLFGCVKNILPGIVFGLCAMVMLFLSAIPLGLGLLITIPIMSITNYTVYRDIFVDEDA